MGIGTVTERLAAKRQPLNEVVYRKSRADIRERLRREQSFEDIIDTVDFVKPGYFQYRLYTIQIRDELEKPTRFLNEYGPRGLLEIGFHREGTSYALGRCVDALKTIVGIELPTSDSIDSHRERLLSSVLEDKKTEIVWGNSHRGSTRRAVGEHLDEGVNVLFIDADHTYDGIKQDFELYHDLVRVGGFVVFHDIIPHASSLDEVKQRRGEHPDLENGHVMWDEHHPWCGVDKFWNELRGPFWTKEFVSHPMQIGKDIDILEI